MQSLVRLTSICGVIMALSTTMASADTLFLFSARHDAASSQVVLVGTGFRNDMRIVLNSAPLETVSVNAGELRAKAPALVPGTYRLVLERRRNAVQRFMVTVFPAAAGGSGTPGQIGPMGPMGPQGPTGPAGPAGPQGLAGVAGARGATGPAGPAGPAGPLGPAGPAGPAGVAGVAGPVGPAGVPGAVGPIGPVGPAGAAGVAGPAGPVGPMGLVGPAGSAGAPGAAGPAGPVGPVGPVGATGAAGPAGPQGAQGERGAQGPAGSAAGATVVAGNGATFGTVVSFQPGSATLVALQHQGVWLVAPTTTDGVQPTSYLALYADAACTSAPFSPLDTNPAPFYRLLQTVDAGAGTGYYAGNPAAMQSFLGMSPLGHPEQCQTTSGGWELPTLAGPLRSIDLTGFPGPFRVQ